MANPQVDVSQSVHLLKLSGLLYVHRTCTCLSMDVTILCCVYAAMCLGAKCVIVYTSIFIDMFTAYCHPYHLYFLAITEKSLDIDRLCYYKHAVMLVYLIYLFYLLWLHPTHNFKYVSGSWFNLSGHSKTSSLVQGYF